MISLKIKSYFNNFFWLFLTFLLSPYFYFQIFLLARRSPAKRDEGGRKNIPLKILVIQTAKIGDLVCTTPVFREIKRKFPSCHLTAMVTAQTKDILKNNPHLDEIILMTDYPGLKGKLKLIKKLKQDKYDWIFSLFPDFFANILGFWSLIPERVTATHQYFGEITNLLAIFNNHRSEYKRHTSLPKHHLSLLKFLGITECFTEKELFIRLEEEKKASDFLRENNLSNDDLVVGISLTTGVEMKTWEPVKYAALADLLIEKLKAEVIFIGSTEDKKTVETVQKMMKNSSIDASGCFKLNELPALMKKLKLFISGDTGPLYIADTVGVPLVDIAGPIDIYEQSPQHPRCRIVQKELYCSPCLYSTSPLRHCKEGHLKCLKDITPEDVFEAAQSLLD